MSVTIFAIGILGLQVRHRGKVRFAYGSIQARDMLAEERRDRLAHGLLGNIG